MPVSLKGGADQVAPLGLLQLTHFEDDLGEVSVDRLGRTAIETKVCDHIAPKCADAARAMHKREFQGWATVAAKVLTAASQKHPEYDLEVIPSPTKDEPGKPYLLNEHHAHIVSKSGLKGYSLALHLREEFSKGKIHRLGAPAKQELPWRRFWSWLVAKFQL